MMASNVEAFKTVGRILNRAASGFYFVTAPPEVQTDIGRRYQSDDIAVFNCSDIRDQNPVSALENWVSCQTAAVFMIVNMQVGFETNETLGSLNMRRDSFSRLRKIWFYLMSGELDEAVKLYRQETRICGQILGRNHPYTRRAQARLESCF